MVKFYIPNKINEAIKLIHEDHKSMERSCMCKVIDRKDGYAIVDMYFPNQDNQGAFTEITGKGLEDFMNWCLENDIEDYDKWNLWMHSHNTMPLFWSSRDQEQKKEYACGGKKHFFHIVTGHGSGTGQTATLDGVRYKGCASFYDINYEVQMDFELGLGLPQEILELEEEIENNRESELALFAERKKKLEEEVEKGLKEYRKQQEKYYKDSIKEAQDYVNKISKKDIPIEFKSVEGLIDSAVKAEKSRRLTIAEAELNGLIADVNGKYNEERNEKVFPFYESLFGEQEEFIPVIAEEKLAQLKENEVKAKAFSSWGKGKKSRDWYNSDDDYQNDDNFYGNGYQEENDTPPLPTPKETPRDWTLNKEGNWLAPKGRRVEAWEFTFFKPQYYYDSTARYRRLAKFYFV